MILARSNGKQNWTEVTKSAPCPICNKPDNCKISLDGGAVWCGRTEPGSVTGPNGGGQYLHILSGENRPASFVHPSHNKRKQKPKRTDWPDVAQALTNCPQSAIDALAAKLLVPEWALTDLFIGHGSIEQWKAHKINASTSAYSMPERSADGTVIGINRRFPNGNKIHAQGGSRGLTFAADWQSQPGPILSVEGASCTAAAHAMGIAVVGRPGAAAGAQHLLELFRDVDRDRTIVIMGERDRAGAGERGAKSIAATIADELDRVIYWAFPPESAQDTRAWLNKCDPQAHRRKRGELDALAARYLDGLEAISVRPDRPAVERFEPLTGPFVELDDYRQQMVDALVKYIGKAGLYGFFGPTGCGKSFAQIVAMRLVNRTTYSLPTHANCAEEAEKLQAAGLDAKAIPQMNEDTCKNWDEARNALDSGISARAAVCPGCPYENSCGYLADSKEALAAAVTICTHARAAKQLSTLVEGRDLLVIEEDPADLIRPTLSVDPRELNDIASVAAEAKGIAMPTDTKDGNYELFYFLDQMEKLSDKFLDDCRAAEATRAVTLPAPIPSPKHLEKHLWRAIKLVVADGTDNLNQPVNPEAMQLIIGILTGSVDRLVIQVDRPYKDGGGRWTICTLVGSSLTERPQGIPVWVQDATGTAKAIGDLWGQAVTDCTPQGRLANQQAVKQIPRDITSKTDPAIVAANLEGWMQNNPNVKKVGVICWKAHWTALFGERSELLTSTTRDRILRDTWFRSGTDRASNAMLDCDALVILGTFRPNQAADKEKLIQTGHINAAADPQQGGWCLRRWEGRTAAGKLIQVDGIGYSDADWRTAREQLCRSTLLQAIGRGRGILAEGIPVTIFSTEPLGPDVELVDPADMRTLKRAILAAVEAVRGYCKNPISTDIGKMQYPEPVQTKQIAAEMGVSESTASRRLQAAREAGLVTRSDFHKGGWLPILASKEDPEPSADRDQISSHSRKAESEIPLPAPPEDNRGIAATIANRIPGVLIAADLPLPST